LDFVTARAGVLALPALQARGKAPDAICLINPWVRSEDSRADALLKTYYSRRFLQADVWRRLLTGQLSLRSVVEPIRLWQASRRAAAFKSPPPSQDLPSNLLYHLSQFDGQIWTVLSGNDLTAAETESLLDRNEQWRRLLGSSAENLLRVAGADHTFTDASHWISTVEWLAERCKAMGRPGQHRTSL
jgi:hypothetical protein